MPTVVAFKGQYRITIPKEIALAKEWKAGAKLRFVEDLQGNIFLKEIKEKKSK